MAGGFAHMTAVNAFCDDRRLGPLAMPQEAKCAFKMNVKFCELGAVAPDYPYMALLSDDSQRWADLMHYERTGDILKAGVTVVRSLTGAEKSRAFAWLLGYTSHVAMDLSVHPVVNLRVGPYEQNKTAHRTCEMHQDAHIFLRLNLGRVTAAEFIHNGIQTCDAAGGMEVISRVWTEMLTRTHPEEAARNVPAIHRWHEAYTQLIDKVAEEGLRLFPIARHLLTESGVLYPLADEVDDSYLKNLRTPDGRRISYDMVFDIAIANVGRWWEIVGTAVYGDPDPALADALVNGNLDTGMAGDRFVFWPNPAV